MRKAGALTILVTALVLQGCTPVLRAFIPPTTDPAVDTSARYDAAIAEEIAERRIAGLALGVVRDGRLILWKGYGQADIEDQVPVTAYTPFLIASQTKMFTAVAVMLLVEDGRVSLDDRIGDRLPDLPAAWHAVTVRQLLQHTGGVPSFTNFDTPPCTQPLTGQYARVEDVLAEVACLPLDFEPGTDWAYSDAGFHILGLLIDRAGGQPYEDFLRDRIFAPLRMNDTHLMSATGDDRAVGYAWNGATFQRGPTLDPMVERSAGGLVSTLIDLSRFDRALRHHELLKPETFALMIQGSPPRPTYGLGFSLRPVADRPQIGHTGGGPAASTTFVQFRDSGLTVIILTNTAQPPGKIQEIAARVAGLVPAVDSRSAPSPLAEITSPVSP